MYYLSRTIAFIACLLTALCVSWWAGLIALAIAALFIREVRRG
jgi:hypothetical protein